MLMWLTRANMRLKTMPLCRPLVANHRRLSPSHLQILSSICHHGSSLVFLQPSCFPKAKLVPCPSGSFITSCHPPTAPRSPANMGVGLLKVTLPPTTTSPPALPDFRTAAVCDRSSPTCFPPPDGVAVMVPTRQNVTQAVAVGDENPGLKALLLLPSSRLYIISEPASI